MHDRSSQDCKVENLVTSSTEVEFARGASLGASKHVNYGSLDVDVAPDGVGDI